MKKFLFTLVFLGFAGVAFAQDPCATTVQPIVRSDMPVGFTFLHNHKDRNGNISPETIPTRARVIVDAKEFWLGDISPVATCPDGVRFKYKTIDNLLFNAGGHTAKITVITAKGESLAASYFFNVSPAITTGSAPTGVQIVVTGQ